jgi:tRNA dimethylallyltransferase
MATIRPLIVIVGPTASGKTALAITLAKRYDGEVICADSRTVFRDMNIGTAKPTAEEMQGIPHWGLDLTQPGKRFTAAAFQSYARDVIADIRSRGKVPIMVGGTGLYVDGVLFNYQYPSEPTSQERAYFEQLSLEELYRYCVEHGIQLPVNDKNKRHLIHAALRNGTEPQRNKQLHTDTYVYGIAVANSVLQQRIQIRTEHMFEDGVVEEAKQLGEMYGWDNEAMTSNIYPLLHAYLQGKTTRQQVMETFMTRDRQLAKRQLTWFRRNPYIQWGHSDDILRSVEELFTTEQ